MMEFPLFERSQTIVGLRGIFEFTIPVSKITVGLLSRFCRVRSIKNRTLSSPKAIMKRTYFIGSIAALALGMPCASFASIHFYQTNQVDTYSANYLDLSNPSISNQVDTKLRADNVGDTNYESYTEGYNPILDEFQADGVNFQGSNFSQTQLNPSTVKYHLDLTALTTNPGDVYFKFHLDPTQFAANGYTGVYNGYSYFEIYQDAYGYVDNGGVWNYTATINGDWSQTGVGTHMHQLIMSPGTGWTVDQNFVFNSLTDTTTFQMHNSNYQYDPSGSTNCQFAAVLYGQAVPEPACWTGLLVGLGALILAKRNH